MRQFMMYLDQLLLWNRSVNLTSITVDKDIVIKHFVDSLAGLTVEEINSGARVLDIGTGAGFPGIPLKIVRDDLRLTLVEPVKKKVSFLYSIVGLLNLQQVEIFHGTFEQFMDNPQSLYSFDYMTTRALRYDSILCKGHSLLSEDGKAMIYSTHSLDHSIFRGEWSLVAERRFELPLGLGARVISILGHSGKRRA